MDVPSAGARSSLFDKPRFFASCIGTTRSGTNRLLTQARHSSLAFPAGLDDRLGRVRKAFAFSTAMQRSSIAGKLAAATLSAPHVAFCILARP
jgi:hypothetical protein